MTQDPRVFRCRDGRVVTVRPLDPVDLDPLWSFFLALPEEDRQHLRVDVSQRDIVARRMSPPPYTSVLRLVALSGERIVAEASLAHPTRGFEAHVGEVRLIVAGGFRRSGLAEYLGRQLLVHAAAEGLEKVQALMMEDQPAAMRCFTKLGFEREGVLHGFVKDVRGGEHDLLIMSLRT